MSTIVSTGFLLPQSVTSNGQETGNLFLNPNNILLADDLFAEGNGTADIAVGNFNFNLPADAVVTGIEFKVKGKRGQQVSPPVTLTFYALDNTSGTDILYPYTAVFTGLTLSNTVHSFGTSNYLFSTAFTADQINNLKLLIVSDGQVFLDDVLMNVYYYVPSSISPIEPDVSGCPDCNSPIQVQAMYLELPFLIGQTEFYLKAGSWQYPDGTPVQPGDVGSCGGEVVFVFDEGKPKADGQNFEENVILSISSGFWTVLPSGVIKFDIGAVTNRGRQFHTPYGHDPLLMSDHTANSKVIISNSALFYSRFLRRCEVDITFSPPINVMLEGANVVNPAHTFNFEGAVSVTQDPFDPFRANILIPGVGTLPPILVDVVEGTTGDTQEIDLTLPDLTISGINRGALVQIITEEVATVVSVLGNGVEVFAQLVSVTDVGNNLRSEQWFIVAPTAGLMSIVITMSQAAYITAGAESWANINQATPTGTVSTNSGTSNAPAAINLTTVDNSVVVDSLGTETLPILYTEGINQVENWSITANPTVRQGASSYQLAGTAPDNVVMEWTTTQNCPFVMTTVELIGITQTIPTSPDIFVKARITDTTTGFLDDKIELVAGSLNMSVVKTILNPGANEKIRYTLDTTGGGGGGNNLIIDQTPLGVGSTYTLLAGTIDGINTTFTVDAGLYITGTLQVFLNGVELQQGSASDWVETSPAAGTFDFIVPPIPGDIITAVYQTTNGTFGAQMGIQFQDEGVNLGTAGTVNTFNVTGSGATMSRAGDIVTLNIPGGSGGAIGGNSFLYVGKRVQTSASNFEGFEVLENIIIEPTTSRVYAPLFESGTGSADKFGRVLRTFINTAGSYYFEQDINLEAFLTSPAIGQNRQIWHWMTDGTQLIAVVEVTYNVNSSSTVQEYRVDVIKANFDGTGASGTNIFNQFPRNSFPITNLIWEVTSPGVDRSGGFITNDGTNIYVPFCLKSSNVNDNEVNTLLEYDIATVTLQNTYTVANSEIVTWGTNMTASGFDPLTGYFYAAVNLSPSDNGERSIIRYEISGATVIAVAGDTSYDFIGYSATGGDESSTNINTGAFAYAVFRDIGATNYTIDILYIDTDRTYSGANSLDTFNYKVGSLTIPKF